MHEPSKKKLGGEYSKEYSKRYSKECTSSTPTLIGRAREEEEEERV